jgi:hypothetical protein
MSTKLKYFSYTKSFDFSSVIIPFEKINKNYKIKKRAY